MSEISWVSFDVAGTVIQDDGVVISSFRTAFSKSEPELWSHKSEELTQYAIKTMGQSKIEVFAAMLGTKERAERAVASFEDAYVEYVMKHGVLPIPGAEETFNYLRGKKILISLTTGFSRKTLQVILRALNWEELFDYSITPQEAGAGRPSPLMLEKSQRALEIHNKSTVVVVGDTIADMQAAHFFGAGMAIGVLTGTHGESELRDAGATFVVKSIADLETLI